MDSILFEQLNISPQVQRALGEIGFSQATPIQAQAIPAILEGYDVIGRSQTGTGKTAAFGIPAIEMVDPDLPQVQVLILCPTRELAMQACGEIQKFARYKRGIKAAAIYGGAPIQRQIIQLKTGVQLVIGTPGRVMDHMRRRTLKLDQVKMVILDEADEMLNMGFREDIETILKEVPQERQTVLFSATIPPAILALTREYQRDPIQIEVGAKNRPIEAISQFYYESPTGRKMDVLNLLLHFHQPQLSIVFCNTKSMVEQLTEYLCSHGISAAGIHGDMKQPARTQVMNRFKSHQTPVLIATDVAARGIDVENVDAVFNYDIPQDLEYYIHRIGRTARAGKKGAAFTIISGRNQLRQIQEMEKLTGATIARGTIPTVEQIQNKQRDRFLEQLAQQIPQDSHNLGEEMVAQALAEGYTLHQLAVSLMELCYQPQLDGLKDVPAITPPPPKAKNTMGIVMGIGRTQKAAPNFILGAIAQAIGLPAKAVGKIMIYRDHTVVEMTSESARLAVREMQSCRINGHKTWVRLLDEQEDTRKAHQKGTHFSERTRGRYNNSRLSRERRTSKNRQPQH